MKGIVSRPTKSTVMQKEYIAQLDDVFARFVVLLKLFKVLFKFGSCHTSSRANASCSNTTNMAMNIGYHMRDKCHGLS
jgi:hypothetical protein